MSNIVTTNLSLELTQQSLQALTEQRNLLKVFIEQQLVHGVDYGIIPGTPKPSLYKPGAEKLTNIFKLGSRIIKNEKIVDRKDNYAQMDVTVEVYHIGSGLALSTCEGIANSHETKNRYRAKYEWIGGVKTKVSEIETPIGDLLNTLSKMAQKRALVGAVILATNASDFFTQDLEDMPDIIFDNSKDAGQKQSEPKKFTPTPKPAGQSTQSKQTSEDPAEYVVKVGKKLNGMKLKDILDKEIEGYIDYIVDGSKKTGKPLSGDWMEFVETAEKYLSTKKDPKLANEEIPF